MRELKEIRDRGKVMEYMMYLSYGMLILMGFVRHIELADTHIQTIYYTMLLLGIMILVSHWITLFNIAYFVKQYYDKIMNTINQEKDSD